MINSEIGNTIIRTPIVTGMNKHTQKTIQKLTIRQVNNTLADIRYNLKKNSNKYALLFHKEKRNYMPRLVEIVKCYEYFVLVRWKCYDPEGKFRCYLRTSILYVDFLTGYSKIKFFDGDI